MRKTPETPAQFDKRVAEFENSTTDKRKIIYEPESVTMQRITAGENARAKEIKQEIKNEKYLAIESGCVFGHKGELFLAKKRDLYTAIYKIKHGMEIYQGCICNSYTTDTELAVTNTMLEALQVVNVPYTEIEIIS